MSRSSRSARAAGWLALLLAAAALPTEGARQAAREAKASGSALVAVAVPQARSAALAAPVGAGADGAQEALAAHYAGLEEHDTAAAGRRLAADYFYVAPWGALEFGHETLARYREAFDTGTLRDYRVEIRAVHTGPAGEGARWFRAIVREKYRRESGRKARNAFAEDLLTTGLAVLEDGTWRMRFMQQTWSDETLRRMIPILHAAQPVDPEEY